MFTRPLFGVGLERQGAILDQVAALVEAGTLRSTLTTTLPWSLEPGAPAGGPPTD